MISEVAVREFPFVATLPKRERSRIGRLWDHFTELSALADVHGMLLPPTLAADLAGVSKQRIQQLMDGGRLEAVEFNGRRYITENSFVEWAKSQRKSGVKLAGLEGGLVGAAKLGIAAGKASKTSK